MVTKEPITIAMAASGLQVLAKADIRNAPPSTRQYEPFACHRCHDRRTVADWRNWSPSWLFERYRPVPRVPCPNCNGKP